MGKLPTVREGKKLRHQPFEIQGNNNNGNSQEGRTLLDPQAEFTSQKQRKLKYDKREQHRANKHQEEFLDPKISSKIIGLVREQQQELIGDNMDSSECRDPLIDRSTNTRVSRGQIPGNSKTYNPPSKIDYTSARESQNNRDDKSDDCGEEEEEQQQPGSGQDELGIFNQDGFSPNQELLELDQHDFEAMQKFMPDKPQVRFNLADQILAKLHENNLMSDQLTPNSSNDSPRPPPPTIDHKVIQVYTKVGMLLSRYKAGKLPKAFKIIPSLNNWEEILYLTSPDKWTPHSTYEATKIFVSNLKDHQVQKFFNLFLLDKVREDIQETRKLNFHLYMALKKALFKPAAFFKGILFPLCDSGTCTLREAVIIGSVISKVSIPVLHSAAALLKLSEMNYSGSNSLFIRLLLDKKYALPYKVIDALVHHFSMFRYLQEQEKEQELNYSSMSERSNDTKHLMVQLPVLWHQSLLVFVQRYKQDLTPEQKKVVLDLVKIRDHHSITPEIRREILNSHCRDEIILDPNMDTSMDIDE